MGVGAATVPRQIRQMRRARAAKQICFAAAAVVVAYLATAWAVGG